MRSPVVLTLALIALSGSIGSTRSAFAQKVDFNRDIRPLLSDRCFQCHGPDAKQRKAELRLDTKDGLFGKRDAVTVVPTQPDKSELLRRIITTDADVRMPPEGKPLTAEQIALIKRWIAEGAEWQGHWAYQKITSPQVPNVKPSPFVRNDIDRFILRKLQQRGMQPSPEASRRVLIRRLKFDLLGLPPTAKEVADFENDKHADAYERLVDRYLKSPHFGERMAMWWLDVVRYADTNGIHGDNHRDVWLFRDYTINSFNANKPFNTFTIEQLAGDLLPNPTTEQKVGSGYNRLLMTTREGGAQAKEYLAKYAADRVRNVSIAWMGSTMGCCECHNHKYDPFSTKDFYSMAAFFGDISETAVGQQRPNLRVPTAEQQAELKRLDEQLQDLTRQRAATLAKLNESQERWETEARKQIADGKNDWNIITPAKSVSSGKAILQPQQDGSVLSTGKNPAHDVYTITIKTDQKNITAFRLEALTHPSLNDGLSRGNGNFVLTRFEVYDAANKPQKIASAIADYSQPKFPVTNAIDNKSTTGWAVSGHEQKGKNRTAVFILDKPLAGGPATMLTVKLWHESHKQHNIGRFRLSLTSSAKPSLSGRFPADVLAALKTDPAKRNAKQRDVLTKHFQSVAPELAALRKRETAIQQQKLQIEKQAPTMLIAEAMNTPRTMRVLPRGNWLDDSGTVVQPAAPAFLVNGERGGVSPRVDPENREAHASRSPKRQTRLDLARWIASADNPLTSRVFVNRLWMLFFGRGIVSSVDDFGAQGTWPTHPALLDWLATDFVKHNWDIKRSIKQIVMSGTYRQSSYADEKLRKDDPYNQWFARQGRFRLDAEMIRDNALAVSGLLVRKMGGPSVKPYQPAGYWSHLNFPRRTYKADVGESQYRRGLYTYWCRTFLHPSLLAFDASTREECTVDRPRSNTPLQALVLLNDPSYVEAARLLAERIIKEGGNSPADRIGFAYQTVLQRMPRAEEVKLLTALAEKHAGEYQKDSKAADELLTVGLKPSAKDIPAVELATWTSIARVLLNLNETITRY